MSELYYMLVDLQFKTVSEINYQLGADMGYDRSVVRDILSMNDSDRYQKGIYLSMALYTNIGIGLALIEDRVIDKIDPNPRKTIVQSLSSKNIEIDVIKAQIKNLPSDVGIADNMTQILNYYKPYIECTKNEYAIFCTPVYRDDWPNIDKCCAYIGDIEMTTDDLITEPNRDSIIFKVVKRLV